MQDSATDASTKSLVAPDTGLYFAATASRDWHPQKVSFLIQAGFCFSVCIVLSPIGVPETSQTHLFTIFFSAVSAFFLLFGTFISIGFFLSSIGTSVFSVSDDQVLSSFDISRELGWFRKNGKDISFRTVIIDSWASCLNPITSCFSPNEAKKRIWIVFRKDEDAEPLFKGVFRDDRTIHEFILRHELGHAIEHAVMGTLAFADERDSEMFADAYAILSMNISDSEKRRYLKRLAARRRTTNPENGSHDTHGFLLDILAKLQTFSDFDDIDVPERCRRILKSIHLLDETADSSGSQPFSPSDRPNEA